MHQNLSVPYRVLVTGGRGFIGAHLVNDLLTNNIEVVSVDIRSSGAIVHPKLTDIVGDIRQRSLMENVFDGKAFDCIYDLASYTEVSLPLSSYRRNVEQTEAMVEYCRKFNVAKYIFYSTQFVFRRPDVLPGGEEDFAPVEAYGESKVLSEKLIRASLDPKIWLILRPTYIWGPGLNRFKDGLLFRLAKKQLLISSDRCLKRYYGYVETVAAQTIAFSELDFSRLPAKVYYLSDDAIDLQEFCGHLIHALGKGYTYRVPSGVIRLLGGTSSLFKAVGLPFPINSVQARELTTNFPVPIGATLALTGKATNYRDAAARTVAWAMQDIKFRRAIA